MSDVRQFTNSILQELSNRMKKGRHSAKSVKELVSLESLINRKNIVQKESHSAALINNEHAGKKTIITEKDILNLGEIQELKIKSGDILTPMAKDLIRKNKLKLIIK